MLDQGKDNISDVFHVFEMGRGGTMFRQLCKVFQMTDRYSINVIVIDKPETKSQSKEQIILTSL